MRNGPPSSTLPRISLCFLTSSARNGTLTQNDPFRIPYCVFPIPASEQEELPLLEHCILIIDTSLLFIPDSIFEVDPPSDTPPPHPKHDSTRLKHDPGCPKHDSTHPKHDPG
jgi:hypothetical protein